MINNKTINILRDFWRMINRGNKKHIFFVIFLMVLNSVFEIASIGAVIPFISILISPDTLNNIEIIYKLRLEYADIDNETILLYTSLIFGIIVIFSAAIKYLLLIASTRLSVAIGCDISEDIYKKTLLQDYIVHISRNSSDIIDGVVNKTGSAIIVIEACLSLISSSIILISVTFTLIYINPLLTIFTFGGIGAIYFLLIKHNHKKIAENGRISSFLSNSLLKKLQEGLGGIREIIIDGTQHVHSEEYRLSISKMREAEGRNRVIGSTPKFLIEAVTIIFIIGLAYFSTTSLNIYTSILPILAALVLGAQRLLPVSQQLYVSWAVIIGNREALTDVIKLLKQPIDERPNQSTKINFLKNLKLQNITYKYSNDSRNLFNEISLVITKGACVGFVGKSGCGKSTLLDIVMGLLSPTSGHILVDEHILNRQNIQQWRSRIAHVPQTIYLIDASVAENIAFGTPINNIDMKRVKEVAKLAQISQDIESWPMDYDTNVGERGVQLSGGQRQRIGIARALYKKAEILIFDEATSALDSETENEITKTLKSIRSGLTILIVAHRHSTLRNCDAIYQIDSTGSLQIINYSSIK